MGVQRLIVAAANKFTYTTPEGVAQELVIVGVRHWDHLMHKVADEIGDLRHTSLIIQGFVDNRGVFLTREEAFVVATEAGQIKEKSGNPNSEKLFSEDIW